MRSHRTTIFIAALCAAVMAASPTSALASSLLSGYGGPGQGSQAILGSAVVNGPRGGGGASGSGGESSGSGSLASESSPSQTRGEATTGGGSGGASGSGGGSGSQASRGSSRSGRGAPGHGSSHAPAPQPTASTASFYPASERVPAGVSSGTLGLSGLDLAFVLIGFAALAFVGVLTGRLARTGSVSRNR